SETLLYLSNGELKKISIDGGDPETLPFDMTWEPQSPEGTTVIQAGALWDGESKDLQENVDIILDGNRIVDIEPRQENRSTNDAKVIDARELTVMPGLWDAHIHQQMTRY